MLKDIRKNPILLTDVYNLSHQRLKVSTDWEVSHMYNRAKPMILFGMLENINNLFGEKIEQWMIDEADEQAKRMGLIFPRKMWEDIIKYCKGYIPVEIQMLPEGTWCPVGTPFLQIRNSIKDFGEFNTWWEAPMMHSYFPSTTATQSYRMYKYNDQKKRQYGYQDSFMLRFHSFGFRGHKSLEDAYWAGVTWNLFHPGTDDFHTSIHTPTANIGSIAALAHKVTQQFDDEFEGYKHAIKATAETGERIVALVIDTYDAYQFINEYLIPLAKYAAELGVHIVVRPDSGDTWEQVALAYKTISRHYLPITNVSAIIGESMDFENAKKADAYFEQHGVPLSFVSYGIGGGFYNYINRDTLGWAMKTSFSNGANRMKFSENPIKRSIPGIVNLFRNDFGDLIVGREEEVVEGLYELVYYHDELRQLPLMKKYSNSHWESVRSNALSQNTEQATIYLSDSIRNEIGEFQKRYRNAVV